MNDLTEALKALSRTYPDSPFAEESSPKEGEGDSAGRIRGRDLDPKARATIDAYLAEGRSEEEAIRDFNRSRLLARISRATGLYKAR